MSGKSDGPAADERASSPPHEYCEVALPGRPVRQTFTYRLPSEMRGRARPGMRALVPFGRRKVVGCIDRTAASTELARVREVLELLDREPVLPPPLLRLCRWIADYYVAPLGLVIRATLPSAMLAESSFLVSLAEESEGRPAGAGEPTGLAGEVEAAAGPEDVEGGGPRRAILDRLARAAGPLQASTLRKELGLGSVWTALREMEAQGLVRVQERVPDAADPTLRQQVIRLEADLPSLLERDEIFGRAHRQREAFETLQEGGGASSVAHLTGRLGFSRSVLQGLVEKGLARIRDEPVRRDPFAGVEAPSEPPPRPTRAQADVIGALREMADADEPGVALLRGVTGSGKTRVYLGLLEHVVLERGRSAIVLVPEIALTPQTVQRFRAVFGDAVAVLHSGLSAGERHDEWRALREGRKRIAIGARSAVFAPLPDLGAIVVDEEHESSYKQSETPRYHARAVAAVRCGLEGAIGVFGSATPSLESWRSAVEGGYRLFELPTRVTAQPLPAVELVDLREEGEARRESGEAEGVGGERRREPVGISRQLDAALRDRLRRGEQSILLLNRRGYSNFVQCGECGHVWYCPSCNVSLTHHRRPAGLVCHHCGHAEPVPERCSSCGSSELLFSGLGTERLERELVERMPGARVARMDLDTTGTKWAHREIFDRMSAGEIDVLLGTQMIAKGLDFPDVTLVGVVNADVSLNLPDFRATERTFQLIAQVAGRAGRGERPGEVVVQTYRPAHEALVAATRHDFLGFAERELAERRTVGYPPFVRLANLVVSGETETAVSEAAEELTDWTRGLLRSQGLEEELRLVGPAPCPIDRLRGRWRWHFLLKSGSASSLGAVLRFLSERRGQPSGDLRLEIDRDPEALL